LLGEIDAVGAHGTFISARRADIEAGIAALEDRPSDALGLYRRALDRLRDLGLPWEAALVGIDMATLLDPSETDVRAAAATARETIIELHATPFLERLDAALARSPTTRSVVVPSARTLDAEEQPAALESAG
jgi:hypothetical protein